MECGASDAYNTILQHGFQSIRPPSNQPVTAENSPVKGDAARGVIDNLRHAVCRDLDRRSSLSPAARPDHSVCPLVCHPGK